MRLRILIDWKCYVAQITNLHPKFRLDRRFIDGERKRGRFGEFGYYELGDGLYEVSQLGIKDYIAVVKGRRVTIEEYDFERVVRRCKESGVPLEQVIREWYRARRRSSATLVEVASRLTEATIASVRREATAAARARRAMRSNRIPNMTARQAFEGSDASNTREYLKRVQREGVMGAIAADLFRCQKASTRAKSYRGSSVARAYARKGAAMADLCRRLASSAVLRWGWKADLGNGFAPWVLYVDLPNGQVSFHALGRGDGPDYPGNWDQQHMSEERILAFCDLVSPPAVSPLEVSGGIVS